MPFSFSRTFWYSNFADDEGDTILIDCSDRKQNTTVPAAWTNCDNNKTSGNVTLYGTAPKDNSASGTYAFKIVVEDEFKDGNKTEYTFTLTVAPKPKLEVTGGPADVTTRLPNATDVTTASYSYDRDNLPYRKVLYVNGSIWTNSTYFPWLVWEETI